MTTYCNNFLTESIINNSFCYIIFIKKYSKRKQQFLKNAISLVKLLFSCHFGNQILIYHRYFVFLPRIIQRIATTVILFRGAFRVQLKAVNYYGKMLNIRYVGFDLLSGLFLKGQRL